MPIVQAAYFVYANTNQITGCKVDDITKVRAEIILSSQYGSSPEEITNMVISIADSSGNAAHCFTWDGDCALRGGATYTIDTPIFTLPVGTYIIKRAFGYGPLSKSLPECGINLTEVPCSSSGTPTTPTSPSGTPTTPTSPTSPSGTPTQATITYRNYSITWNMVTGFYYVTSPSGISLGGYDKLSDAQARIDRAIAAGG